MSNTHLLETFLVALISFSAAACGSSANEPCAVGESSCACDVGGACRDGLACDTLTNLCEGTRTISLPAIDGAARSCELLIEDDSASVVGADFASSVHGESIRQAPRTAVTFYADTDAPIGGSAVRIEVLGTGEFSIKQARCFDRSGVPIPGGGIAVDG
jgi:hypothetical protein